jgi:hypothetical protein
MSVNMCLKTLACQLIPTVISVLLLLDPVSARMGLLYNCDFLLSQIQISPGSFQFYSDWLDPPSRITYKGKSISSHPATRHFWLFIQVQSDGLVEAINLVNALRQNLDELLSEAGLQDDPHLETSLRERLLADFRRDVQEKGDCFEIIVVYHPQLPFPNPRVNFQTAHPRAVYFYLLVVYNLEIWGATDLIWSDYQVAVTLSSFTAIAGDGRVVLEWTTIGERQSLGFDILRRDFLSGTFVRLNEQLIPAASGGNSQVPLNYRFVDEIVSVGMTYEYQLEEVDFQGERTICTTVVAIPSASGATPVEVRLFPNYPNPFNANTEIRYQISQDSHVTMSIYDIRGELVRVLVNNPQSGGEYLVPWDGHTMNGHIASSGLYFCALQAAHNREVMKMILIR